MYEKTSGQVVNYEKSTLSFSSNTSANDIDEIKNDLSISVVHGHELYLGLSNFSLRNSVYNLHIFVSALARKSRDGIQDFSQ